MCQKISMCIPFNIKMQFKIIYKKNPVLYDMNMVTVRALISDLSVLQHQLHPLHRNILHELSCA